MNSHRKLTLSEYQTKQRQIHEHRSPKSNKFLTPQKKMKILIPKIHLTCKQFQPKLFSNRSAKSYQNLNLPFTSKMTKLTKLQSLEEEFKQCEIKNYHLTIEQKSPKQEGIEKLRTQLNEQFLKESSCNRAGACLQFLEPPLVHNLLNLSPKAKVNSNLRASVSSRDQNGNTALHYAARNGNTHLVQALLYKDIQIDTQNEDKMTPLLLSAYYGKFETLQILINLGANINHQDIYGNSSLHYACKFNFKQIVQFLLQKSHLILLQNQESQYPDYYIEDSEIAQIFADYLEQTNCKNIKIRLEKRMKEVIIQTTQTETILKMFQRKNIKSIKNLIQKCKSSNNLEMIQDSYPKIKQLQTTLQQLEQFKNQLQKKQQTFSTIYSESCKNIKEDDVSLSQFQILGLIGKGSFGQVYLVKRQNQLYAMKVLDKIMVLKQNLFPYAQTERNVLSMTSHPFIVKLRYAFQTTDKLIMMLDYCPGGDLGQLLEEEQRLPEEQVKNYICEIILALEDLHQRDIIYRDLKPENIVIDADGHAILTDFGLSKEGIFHASQGARSFCGSVAYLAPEMLKRKGHGKAVDWYLLGVVMYELLVGVPPYYDNEKDQLFDNIENATLKIPSFISFEGRNLIKLLLKRNPIKRLGSGVGDSLEIKQHPYFQDVDWEKVKNKELELPKPTRKIKIDTQIGQNLFQNEHQNLSSHIHGWSYVHTDF
ncbi:unnamed protein product (macronuclear) [Paramecium tetraurelia]|uniref:Protein kinase domain-containing protein n=1 Tax=Paramecium tetraurelia TaxID=5888 RepID=A0E4K1_PARTE|nr:uncharacterized protein GSPATT00023393001 [Paramecium tetraurelia]CAK90218.1 unnamed protein product [Paramecium tetraurelia]|eukprot:XP_001457615.1 hypothetical protein (macronuclear) [Paramecium tetraurelia strain d4-2]